MVLRAVNFLSLSVTGIILLTCDFFQSSRRGILTAHWIIISFLTSCSWERFKTNDIGEIPGSEILLPLSTMLLIFDHFLTSSTPSDCLCLLSRCLMVLLLCVMDAVCLILALELRYEISLVVLSLMIFTGVLLFSTTPLKLNMQVSEISYFALHELFTFQIMYDYSTDGLFSDYDKASNCLGRYGSFLYTTILIQLLREVN